MKTLEEFIDKHKEYYLTALDNDVRLEVDCRKRRVHPTDEEIADLKAIGYTNTLGSNMTLTCCGISSFLPINKALMSLNEEAIIEELGGLHAKFLALERMHPMEIQEWVTSIHALQNMLAYRIAKKDHPEIFK